MADHVPVALVVALAFDDGLHGLGVAPAKIPTGVAPVEGAIERFGRIFGELQGRKTLSDLAFERLKGLDGGRLVASNPLDLDGMTLAQRGSLIRKQRAQALGGLELTIEQPA
jgi:hypothetical protein